MVDGERVVTGGNDGGVAGVDFGKEGERGGVWGVGEVMRGLGEMGGREKWKSWAVRGGGVVGVTSGGWILGWEGGWEILGWEEGLVGWSFVTAVPGREMLVLGDGKGRVGILRGKELRWFPATETGERRKISAVLYAGETEEGSLLPSFAWIF